MKITLQELKQLIKESILENAVEPLTPEQEEKLKAAGYNPDEALPLQFWLNLQSKYDPRGKITGATPADPNVKLTPRLMLGPNPALRDQFIELLIKAKSENLQESIRRMVREEVKRHMIETRHNAGMFPVAAVLDEPRVAEAINLLKNLSKGDKLMKKQIIDRLNSMD